MILQSLVEDLISNPLLQIFAIIEIFAFLLGLWGLIISYKKATDISELGDELKNYFIKNREENSIQIDLVEYHPLSQRIIRLINKPEIDDVGIDKNELELIVKNEYEKPLSFVRMFINILPVIGLIGTFIGISIAVYQLSFSENINEIYTTIVNNLKSLNPFLDGIKLAFFSTVIALLFALILRIIYEIFLFRSKNILVNFQNYITVELIDFIKPTGTAEKIAKSINNFSKRVTKLSNDIEKSLNHIVVNYSTVSEYQQKIFEKSIKELNNIDSSINNNLRMLWTDINNTLEKVTNKIDLASKNYLEISEKSLEIPKNISEIMLKINEENKLQINNTEAIGKAVRKLTDDSDKIVNGISNFILPLDDLREKYLIAVNKAIELNKPFQDTNSLLKDYFENLIRSITDLQSKSNALIEKLNNYASSLESYLGTKLNSIIEKEDNTLGIINEMNEIQGKFEKSIGNLKEYSESLEKSGRGLAESISGELKSLFIDLSKRQDITINNYTLGGSQNYEETLAKKIKTNEVISSTLKNLNDVLGEFTKVLNKPPFFSLRRWFGNNK